MTTSGTTSFSLPLDELLEAAAQRVGGEPILGTEARLATRILNLLFTDLQNRNVPLHTIELVSASLVSGTTQVTVASDTIDVLDMVLATSSVDFPMFRIGFGEWLNLPKKSQTGTPTTFYVDRRRDAPVIYIWPIPSDNTKGIKYFRERFVQDASKLGEDPDFPRRYYPALVAGLAYYLALSRGLNFPMDRLAMLKAEYEEQLMHSVEEDRERASIQIVPNYRGRRY